MSDLYEPDQPIRFIRGTTATGFQGEDQSEARQMWVAPQVEGKVLSDRGGPHVIVELNLAICHGYPWRVDRSSIRAID